MESKCVHEAFPARVECPLRQAVEISLLMQCDLALVLQGFKRDDLLEILEDLADWFREPEEADHIETIEEEEENARLILRKKEF